MGLHTRLTYADVLREERARVLQEYNSCHHPAGSGAGGRFCGRQGHRGRAATKWRAKEILHRTAHALARAQDPTRQRTLKRRAQTAQAALDYLKATGFWGTLTGAADARWVRRGPRYPGRMAARIA